MQASHALWFGEFAETYRDLLRFLRRRTGNDDTARDLAQDAWLRATEQHGAGPGAHDAPATREHARAWLFTVAERLAIDHHRRQRHWHDELAPRLSAGPRHAPDVAESHAYAQALRAVEHALARMPARTRDVFIAHRLGGVPHEALAQQHEVSSKTIEREITRAMDLAQAALCEPAPVTNTLPAGRPAARARAAGTPQRQGRRKAIGALLGVAGLGTTAGLAWQVWRDQVPQWQTRFATATGRTGRLGLPDGSVLALDADSAIDVRLMAGRREVHLLRGGAFFDVARDAVRPFVVVAGPARVTVLGTRFAVECVAQGVGITVASGRVRVRGAAEADAVELGAGDAAHVDAPGKVQAAPPRRPEDVAPWRTGWLQFDHVALGEVAARLARYRPGAPVRVSPEVAALPVLAQVDIARSNQWLLGLPAVLPVRVSADADGGVSIRAR